jgi:hypothetical protein
MEKKRQGGAQPSQQANVHPEMQPPVRPAVADGKGSKRQADEQGHDARTGHDKDANEQQGRAGRGRG